MSNATNLHKCLLQIPLDQSITVSMFLHWFKPIASRMFLFVSKIALLIPNYTTLFLPDLWVLLLNCCKIFFMIFQSYKAVVLAIYFQSVWYLYFLRFVFHQHWSVFFMLLLAFLYVKVMALFIIWSYSAFVNR